MVALVETAEKAFTPTNMSPAEAERLTGAFLQACWTGDVDTLVSLLATDAVLYSDSGGKATAALVPIFERESRVSDR